MASGQARARAAIGLVLASTLLASVALEIGLRLVGWEPRLESEWMLGNPMRTLDPDVITVPRRLLDPAFYAPTATPLVLTIGDSFTEGFPVDDNQSYPAVLQRLLTDRGIAATVRNAGMGDSGPDQHLRLLVTRLLPNLHPAVVVWQFFANDVWDNVTKSVYRLRDDQLVPVSAARHWMTLRQHVFDWTPLPSSLKKHSRLFKLVLRAVERTTQSRPPGDPVSWSLAKITRELDEFERLGAMHGFVPYVVLVPPQSVYLAKTEHGAWNERWSATGNQSLATLLHVRPGFIDGYLGDAAADADFSDGDHETAARGDRHLNARGYARLAVLIARRLLHDGVLARDGAAVNRVSVASVTPA